MKTNITMNRAAGIVAQPSIKRLTKDEIKQAIPPDEAIKIGYIPLILMRVIKRYMDSLITVCVKNKLPYVKETRELRKLWEAYEMRVPMEPGTTGTTLDEIVDTFFDKAGMNVEVLRYSINHELFKAYIGEKTYVYELHTYSYCVQMMAEYTIRYEIETSKHITELIGVPYKPYEIALIQKIYNICKDISSGYPVNREGMINMAMDVIGQKVDSIIIGISSVKI